MAVMVGSITYCKNMGDMSVSQSVFKMLLFLQTG